MQKMLPHYTFAQEAARQLEQQPFILGLALGGSFMEGCLDEFSDLDFHLVVADSHRDWPLEARCHLLASLGTMLCAYPNGHDARVLVSLYDCAPLLLHVDWKWISLQEFEQRVENPIVLFERASCLTEVMNRTNWGYLLPDWAAAEPKFWTWMHYVLSKLGRGELLEAVDYLCEVRSSLVGPMILHKNGFSPRRMRRAEQLPPAEWQLLEGCIVWEHSPAACFKAIMGMIEVYCQVRQALCPSLEASPAQAACLNYAEYIRKRLQI
jgi:hypothetical protein